MSHSQKVFHEVRIQSNVKFLLDDLFTPSYYMLDVVYECKRVNY